MAVFFVLQALSNGKGVIRGDAPSSIDWYDPLISLLVGLAFFAIWVRSRARRQRWKRLRDAAPPPVAATLKADR